VGEECAGAIADPWRNNKWGKIVTLRPETCDGVNHTLISRLDVKTVSDRLADVACAPPGKQERSSAT
jgi:hypothetical protein